MSLQTEIVRGGGFTVIGITGRTNNSRETSADDQSVIAQLWDRWFRERIFDRIPHRIDAHTLALYYNYAGDKYGDYNYMIGIRVGSAAAPAASGSGTPAVSSDREANALAEPKASDFEIPEGMELLHVPMSCYVVLDTSRGAIWDKIPLTWKHIWDDEDSGELNRSYRVDYELFDERAADPNDAIVGIWVGVL